ncbi:MAG: MBL fold metallo-hydrolase [Varibaculum sp.]|nr:MBL fold metallo-hydrolase [Varibaculum sp.]
MLVKRGVHACVEFRSGKTLIVVDPGAFGLPADLPNADAILVTHDHFDHVDHAAVAAALAQNPAILVAGPQALADSAQYPVRVLSAGDTLTIGSGIDELSVEVVGRWQDITSRLDPPIQNLGYIIGGRVLHGGDALIEHGELDAVFVPLAAPWAKNIDVQDYLRDYPVSQVLGFHDWTLSEEGLEFAMKTLQENAEAFGARARALRPGESAEL